MGFLHTEKVWMVCILWKLMTFNTYLGGSPGSGSTSLGQVSSPQIFYRFYLLFSEYTWLSFQEAAHCSWRRGMQKEDLENAASRAEACFFTFSFLQATGASCTHGTSIYGQNILLLFDYFYLYKAE